MNWSCEWDGAVGFVQRDVDSVDFFLDYEYGSTPPRLYKQSFLSVILLQCHLYAASPRTWLFNAKLFAFPQEV